MRNLSRILLATAVIAGGTVTTASAANWSGNTANVCGGDKFSTCASVNVSWSGLVVTIVASNLGSQGEIWDAIGLFNLPKCWGVGGSCQGNNQNWSFSQTSGPGNWTGGQTQGLIGAGISARVAGSGANNPSPQNGLGNGFGGTWVLTFSGFFTQAQFDAGLNSAGFGVHAISGPQGCSTKLAVTSDGQAFQNVTDAECISTTVTPEPMTLTLLASGLLGLAGAGVIRRRRRTQT